MARQVPTMLIYPEDKEFIYNSTLKHQNIETGGDLFGLWQSESEIVVQIASGPGKYCRRSPTSFFQDEEYLKRVGEYLTSSKGLCNVGEWHSHHSLNLPEPSSGDRATVWRNMPTYGLKRFLLIIATISPTRLVEINGYLFTAPKSGRVYGEMDRVQTRVLTGPNPFRRQPDVLATLHEGAEPPRDDHIPTPRPSENDESVNVSQNSYTTEPKKTKKKKAWREPKKNKAEKKLKKDKAQKKIKKVKEEDGSKKGKKGFPFFRKRRSYANLPDDGGKSGTFSQRNVEEDSNCNREANSQNSDSDEHYDPSHAASQRGLIHHEFKSGMRPRPGYLRTEVC